MSTVWGSVLLMAILIVLVEVLIESLGLIGQNYRPIMKLLRIESSDEEEKK